MYINNTFSADSFQTENRRYSGRTQHQMLRQFFCQSRHQSIPFLLPKPPSRDLLHYLINLNINKSISTYPIIINPYQ